MDKIGQVWKFAIGAPSSTAGVVSVLKEQGIAGATLSAAMGVWNGDLEQTIVVHIAGLNQLEAEGLAHTFRREFAQEAIYVETLGVAYLATLENAGYLV